MNISPDGVSVRFKTEPEELFEAEKSGVKSNTVRILDVEEYHQLRKENPKKIIIQYQQEIFLRTITNIHVTEGVFGKVIVVISWTNEEHHHVPTVGPHSVPVEPGDHNIAIDHDDVRVLPIPSICACVNCIRGMREGGVLGPTPEQVIEPDCHVLPRESDDDESFVDIRISKQMFKMLQISFSDRTMNSIVQELYETYLFKLAEERGQLHD